MDKDVVQTYNEILLRHKKEWNRTSLVVQQLEIHLPMQGIGADPWSRRSSHATAQLRPWAAATEAHEP